MQGDTLGKSEMMILSKSLMKPITNLCSQLNIAPPTLFSIWQIIILSKWIWPSFRNEDLHLRDKSHSALCKLSFALVNDKLQEAEYDKHRLPKAGARTVLSKWVILKWLSLWNDIWLSLRKKRQRPQSFWNDISTIALKWHFERNCLLHALGVFRVFAYWILTKFNRQTPG